MTYRVRVLGAVVGLLWLLAGPSRAAAILPLDQIRAGQTGYGLTVFEGTKIDRFEVEVVGVLYGFDFQMDMILIEVTSGPVVARDLGSVSGMSGSPIYINDKLIGAYAYGFPFQKTALAGVTPIEQMLEHYRPGHPQARALRARREAAAGPTLPAPTGRPQGAFQPAGGTIELDGHLVHEVRLATSQQEAQAWHENRPDVAVMAPVATPLLVRGIGGAALSRLTTALAPLNLVPQQAGAVRAPAGAAASFRLAPGAAVGVALATGDIEMTAVGTLTYVEGEELMAFGHPFMGFGQVEMPLTSAYIAAIVPNVQGSFKLGGSIAPIGTVTEDRPTCIGGVIGEAPPTIPSVFRITDLSREAERTYRFQATRQGTLTPLIASMLLSGSIENAAGADFEGVVTQRVAVGLRDGEEGDPLEVVIQDCFDTRLGGMGLQTPVMDLSGTLAVLRTNPWGDAPVDRIDVDLQLEPDRKLANIERARAAKQVVRRGETVELTVSLREYGGKVYPRTLAVAIPANAPLGPTLALVAGGALAGAVRNTVNPSPFPVDVPSLVRRLNYEVRGDSLVVEMVQPMGGVELEGRVLADLPAPLVAALNTAEIDTFSERLGVVEQIIPSPDVVTGYGLALFEVVDEDGRKADRGTTSLSGLNTGPSPMESSMGMGGGMMMMAARRELSTLLGPSFEAQPTRWSAEDARVAAIAERVREVLEPAWAERLAKVRPTLAAPAAEARQEAPEVTAEAEAEKKPSEDETPDVTADLALDKAPPLPSYGELNEVKSGKLSVPLPNASGGAAGGSDEDKPVARGVTTWTTNTPAQWIEGHFERTYADTAGSVYLAPQVRELARPDAERVWALLAHSDGSTIAGSWGTRAKVLRLVAGQAPELLADLDDAGIGALAELADGAIIAAASPSGRLYRVAAGAEPTVWATLPDPYVWALVPDGAGGLYAATGHHGRLYQISGSGTPTELIAVPDRHITAVARAESGDLLLGTYPDGKVFRLRDGALATVHQVAEGSVTALAFDDQQRLYVGTSGGKVDRLEPDGAARELVDAGEGAVYRLNSIDGVVYASTAAPGQILRFDPQNVVSQVHEDDESMLLGAVDDGQGGLVLATASLGRVLRVGLAEGQAGEYLSDVHDAGMIARWGQLRWRQEVDGRSVIGIETRTGNTIDPDAAWSEWSPLAVRPEGSPIASPPARYIQFRARFLGQPEDTLRLDRVDVQYRTVNRAPQISYAEPVAGSIQRGKVTLKWKATDPDEDEPTYEVFYAPAGTTEWTKIEAAKDEVAKTEAKPAEDAADGEGAADETTDDAADEEPAGEAETQARALADAYAAAAAGRPGAVGLAWLRLQADEGLDPVDEAAAAAEAAADIAAAAAEVEAAADVSTTLTVTTELTEQELAWDTKDVPDGWYQIRVVASDARRNPDDPRSAEVVSKPFRLDNTAPVGPVLDAGLPASFVFTDATSWITSAEYRWGDGRWIGWLPVDGLCDQASEEFATPERPVEVEADAVFAYRVRDAAGNLLSGQWPPAEPGAEDKE